MVVADLNGAGAEAAASKLGSDGLAAVGVAADVTDPASAAAMVARAVEAFGGLDILVNNAGIMSAIPKGKLTEVDPRAWVEAMRVNALSVLVCTQAAVPAMRARGGGKIINQSPLHRRRVRARRAAYRLGAPGERGGGPDRRAWPTNWGVTTSPSTRSRPA